MNPEFNDSGAAPGLVHQASLLKSSSPMLAGARKYLTGIPPAVSGEGGDRATYGVALLLINKFGLTEEAAIIVFREWNATCVPPWSEQELIHKIRSASNARHIDGRGKMLGAERIKDPTADVQVRRVAKPVFRAMVLKRVAAKAGFVGDVIEFVKDHSPVKPDDQSSSSVLRQLYPQGSGETVLIFSNIKSQGQMAWKADAREVIQDVQLPAGPDGVWFLAQPVDGGYYPNPRLGGKMSRRSEESVKAWRYVVLESDEADPDDWLRCLIQMPLRIACICESGGRSFHALVRIDAPSKADWDLKVGKIKPALITLGADPGALSAVRLTRLPQAKRGERTQILLYLNPVADGTPIISLATKSNGFS